MTNANKTKTKCAKYEIFASYWPDHEDQWPGINQVKKYVASYVRDGEVRTGLMGE